MNTTLSRAIASVTLAGLAAVGFSAVAHAEMFGDPDGMAGWTVPQAYNDCALMAAADVIGQMTGNAPDEDDIVDYAVNTPSNFEPGNMIFTMGDPDTDPDAGTSFRDLPRVLSHYGVGSRYVDGASLGALENVLNDGGAVIVTLNAEMIWGADGDQTVSDHAVVVTGVDTDAGIVHLNDSGGDDGADEQVTLDTFTAAWQTGGNEMVVTT